MLDGCVTAFKGGKSDSTGHQSRITSGGGNLGKVQQKVYCLFMGKVEMVGKSPPHFW